ncbi:phage terminase large subunit [Bradyrhizobium xenonodulans]|uniref:Phage terminase large subunit n=1 Tax=Bradyrhizobium xenonodulans TaxID=2736875 RepID=A0ABY7MPN1_9BRAD|nr:phage terminase large subunit [Bradyrhizobium xenonodulans]WBL80353.1 phage terminase large subunit [Bradyrhizobium xenonodulans]
MPTYTRPERDAIFRSDPLAFAMKAFSKSFPSKTYSQEWFHELIALKLMTSLEHATRQIINAPPRSLKSFIVSAAWPAFRLGQDPTHKFICVSYSQVLANEHSANCRRIMESSWYRNLFPTRLAKSTEDQLVTMEGGSRLAMSVGGTLTGFGADTIIVDDPLNANGAASDGLRQSCNEWFDRSLVSRLDDKAKGSIIVLMQRLHLQDLTGHLIERDGWDHLALPAIAPEIRTIQLKNRSYVWAEGQPLQKRESLKTLDDTRSQVGSAVFQTQYLQDPAPDEGNDLKREWLRSYDILPSRQPGDEIVLSCDTAAKAGANSNYSTCLAFLVRNRNQYYLIDLWRGKVEFPALCQIMLEQWSKHRPGAVLIEDTAMGSPLIHELDRRGLQGLLGIKPTQDKRSRMSGETAKLQAGSLVVPRTAPWLDDFLLEYVSFPFGKTDDMMDALSQFLTWRTQAEQRTTFEADWGNAPNGSSGSQARLGAPSATEILGWLR